MLTFDKPILLAQTANTFGPLNSNEVNGVIGKPTQRSYKLVGVEHRAVRKGGFCNFFRCHLMRRKRFGFCIKNIKVCQNANKIPNSFDSIGIFS